MHHIFSWRPKGPLGLSCLLVLIALLVVCSGVASGQQPTPAPMDTETVKALLQRMQDLESEVRTLKSQVQALTVARQANPAPENATEPPAAKAGISVPPANTPEQAAAQ